MGEMPAEPDMLDRILASINPSEWGAVSGRIKTPHFFFANNFFAHSSSARSNVQSVLRELRDEMKSFVLAGHETSASMLTWSMYELSLNNDILNKLLKEGRYADALFVCFFVFCFVCLFFLFFCFFVFFLVSKANAERRTHRDRYTSNKLIAHHHRSVFPSARGAGADGKDEFQASTLPPTAELNKLTYTVNVLKVR